MTTLLSILILASSIVMIGSVIVSDSAENNMSAITGQKSEKFFGTSSLSSKQSKVNTVTLIAAIVFAVSLILITKF